MTSTASWTGVSTALRGWAPRRAAHAHSGVESYVYLNAQDGTFRGSVHFPVHDLNHVLGLGLPEGDEKAGPAVAANRSALEAYAREHLMVGDGSVAWQLEFGRDRVLASHEGTYAILEFRVAEHFSSLPEEVVIGYDGIIHANEDRTARVMVKSPRGWGRFRRAPEVAHAYSAGNTKHTFPVEEATLGRNITGTATVMTRRLVKKVRRLVGRFGKSDE